MAAVRRYGFFVGTLPLQLQELLADANINGIPRKNFVLTITTCCIEILINAALAESIIPLGIIKILIPAIQPRTVFNGRFNNLTKTAVTPGKYSLQPAQIRAVVVVFNGLGIEMFLQKTAAAQVLLRGDLLFPLEGRMGLGNKISGRYMDPQTTLLFTACSFQVLMTL